MRLPIALLGLFGCGDERTKTAEVVGTAPASESAPARADSFAFNNADGAKSTATPTAKAAAGDSSASPRKDSGTPAPAPRKIIYNAQVTLVVESLTGFDARLATLVKESGGYVSQTDQSSQAQSQRHASWTIRVPVERFDGFFAAVSRLGELQQSHLDSQDVTMEYYDLEARIANKQQEETRLQKHLVDSTGKLDEILAVERELSRVRGEVEQMQGRIRYLGNLAAMSTVTLTVSEVRNYTPPERPTFAGQAARTFRVSLETLIQFGKTVALFVVALAPWLPLLVVLGLLIRWWVRRLGRGREPVGLTRPTS